jgi:type III secretory pathway component EscT
MPSWLDDLNVALSREGAGLSDLGRIGLAWARTMPAVTIVPAFGLRALPAPGRALLGLALAATIFPAVAGAAGADTGGLAAAPWVLRAGVEVARGLSVAIAAAAPLWAATMAGGVADALRGSQEGPNVAVVEGRATPTGVPLSLLASAIFLTTGGPARIARALAAPPVALAHGPVIAAVQDLAHGTTLAVALGAPLLAAGAVIEIAAALVARAASPAQVHALLAPLRALAGLVVLALVFDRLEAALAAAVVSAP